MLTKMRRGSNRWRRRYSGGGEEDGVVLGWCRVCGLDGGLLGWRLLLRLASGHGLGGGGDDGGGGDAAAAAAAASAASVASVALVGGVPGADGHSCLDDDDEGGQACVFLALVALCTYVCVCVYVCILIPV